VAAVAVTPAQDLADLQGLLVRGYGNLTSACFLLLEIVEPAAARAWLALTADLATAADSRPMASSLNVALTSGGLRTLGLDSTVIEMFSNEFVEGMATPFRQRLLGDTGESAPESWAWGGPKGAPIHVAVMLYAVDEGVLATLRDAETRRAVAHGLRTVSILDTVDLAGSEHFGFRDGVSQPAMAGLGRPDSAANTVAAGEFVLGYANQYGLFGERPVLPRSVDAAGILPLDVAGSGGADFGRNGSYLVFRQLSQDVRGFWRYVDHATRRLDGTSDPVQRTRLASKMVGRWPSGASLVVAPENDDPSYAKFNDFLYQVIDRDGLRCPVGSHIRRANPRDSLDPSPGSRRSVEVTNHHRVLRRGREYGNRVEVATLFDEVAEDEERGLHFVCLNANIARQFEFLQKTWINSPKFGGLHEGDDPLIGPRQALGDTFTVPVSPVRTRVRGMPRFVAVRGGAYFFLPGRRALRYLASLEG
jgi:Dyp-type peroxidase family